MTAEPTADRRGVASHWKMAGLVAGGLAVGYALVQERERVAGAVANVQDTLTNNGLTLMQKLSEMADAFLAKVHETFVAAAPPTNLEAAVRHGLTGQSDDAVTTPVPRERPRAPRRAPQITRNLILAAIGVQRKKVNGNCVWQNSRETIVFRRAMPEIIWI